MRSAGLVKKITSFFENLHEVLCEITTSEVQVQNGVRQGVALINRHAVVKIVTRIYQDDGLLRAARRDGQCVLVECAEPAASDI